MIDIKNITKIYQNGFRAVDGLSLHIAKGELVVLIGPSGCGKTTTMRMINRLIALSSGEILIEGRNNQEIPAEELRRNIGYAIQQIGLFPHMTVAQNIATVPRLLEWEDQRIRRRVDELLELVGLEPNIYRDKYPRQLSGGQQQRVGVARALGADPPIMLMDEPFGAVDPITREILQDEFIQIQNEVEKTIVFVTHDIDEAIKMGDRIAILRDGKLVQYDTPETILEHPKGRFVRSFVGSDRQLKRLGLINIKDLMDRDIVRVYMDATAQEAMKTMEKYKVRSVFVVERDTERLKGWVNKEDLEVNTSLLDAMLEAPFTDIAVRERATAREALSVMVTRGFRVTPVVDGDGRLVGSIQLRSLEDLGIYDTTTDMTPTTGEQPAQ